MWGLGVQITNAYVMYKALNMHADRNKKDLISHHDFRKRIALYWINPEECSNDTCNGTKRSLFSTSSNSRRRRKTQSDNATSASSMSKISTGVIQMKKSRACTVSDTSLLHSSSLSRTRMNRSLDHIGNIGKPSARCALHRWLGYETEKDVHYCTSCNVNLCVPCNQNFHTVPDIIKMRATLTKRYKKKS